MFEEQDYNKNMSPDMIATDSVYTAFLGEIDKKLGDVNVINSISNHLDARKQAAGMEQAAAGVDAGAEETSTYDQAKTLFAHLQNRDRASFTRDYLDFTGVSAGADSAVDSEDNQ